jgi:cytochrome P450
MTGSDRISWDRIQVTPLLSIQRVNPYPAYRRLHEKGRVLRSPTGAVFISGHQEATAVLRDPRCLKMPLGRGQDVVGSSVFFVNPPDHGRLRSALSRPFSPNQIATLRPMMETRVDRLLDLAAARGGMDLISEFALPLATGVIAEILGIEEMNIERCVGWSEVISEAFAPVANAVMSDADEALVIDAGRRFGALLRSEVSRLRKAPRTDLLSAMVQALDQGVISEDELVANGIALFAAGFETTVPTIGNAVVALDRHPEERRRLDQDLGLMESMIEETLRFDPPVQMTTRRASERFELGGQSIERDQELWVLIAAANRDPAVFPDPERFEIGRHPNPHLAFSAGAHFCLGAALARVEAAVALRALCTRFPRFGLGEREPALTHRWIRGYQRLPIELHSA